MSNDKKCCILCTCLPSANRHVLRQRAPSSIFSAQPEPLPPTWQTCKVSSFTRRLLPAAGCRRRDCLCHRLCHRRLPPQSVVAPCFKTAHVCQIKWVVSADKPREPRASVGRVEPSQTLPRRCRLLSVSLRKLC